MKTLKFEQDELVNFFEQNYQDEAAQAMARAALLEFVRTDVITPSKAAELLGMHLTEFVHLMADHNIPYFKGPLTDMDELYKRWKSQRARP